MIRPRLLLPIAERLNSLFERRPDRVRRQRWLLMPGVVVALACGMPFIVQPLESLVVAEGVESDEEQPRARMLKLLTQIHSRDHALMRQAQADLQDLGLTDEQLHYASRLKHPNALIRMSLARELAEVDPALREELQSELARDPDPRVAAIARSSWGTFSTCPETKPTGTLKTCPTKTPTDVITNADSTTRLDMIDDEHDFDAVSLVTATTTEAAASASITESGDNIFEYSITRSTTETQTKNAADDIRPNFLKRTPAADDLPYAALNEAEEWIEPEREAPFGFTGPSGILPFEAQENSHFVPQPDRWRNGYAPSDRYGKGHPWVDDYHGVEGHWWDPYNQNVLKGDYPIYGQHTFFEFTGQSLTRYEYRQVPTPTTPFESTVDPNQKEFFGNPAQNFINQNFVGRFALFHANDAAFKPLDWQFVATPVINVNRLEVRELAIVNPDVRAGRTRKRYDSSLQEYFVETKLADISPNYDFVSVRAGSQPFNSDFRGLIFSDCNRGVRLFGTNYSNRHQYNLAFFDMTEKETNSGLNTFDDRHQNVLIANYYIQDFVFPGYTVQTSFHYNNDAPSTRFDRNNFLVRPDPAGVYQPHRVEAYYVGLAGDGHIDRFNVSHAFYWVGGRDGLNPIAGDEIDINAYLAAIELSYDRDWARFRTSFFYASGDDNPYDRKGEGFDSILDNQVFAGGEFSYWNHQQIGLFGVNISQRNSLLPDMRSSKLQGQANFTNPGLMLFNVGFDADITPKLKMINNANYLLFNDTAVLEQFIFQRSVSRKIGLDLSSGFEWRPFHNDNMILTFGGAALVPDRGFKDLYKEYVSNDVSVLFAAFFEAALTF